jgi:Holliday junction resolvase RusA-like endonuclease
MQSLKYKLDIEGYPCQRPRLGKNGAYNPAKYTKHKNDLIILMKSLNIPKKNYKAVKLAFYFPYPKSTPLKKRIDLAPMNYKYDIDNLIKSFFDALQQSGVITDDRTICGVYAIKLFSVENKGWIEFDIE